LDALLSLIDFPAPPKGRLFLNVKINATTKVPAGMVKEFSKRGYVRDAELFKDYAGTGLL
jgi:hypothetical protein